MEFLKKLALWVVVAVVILIFLAWTANDSKGAGHTTGQVGHGIFDFLDGVAQGIMGK